MAIDVSRLKALYEPPQESRGKDTELSPIWATFRLLKVGEVVGLVLSHGTHKTKDGKQKDAFLAEQEATAAWVSRTNKDVLKPTGKQLKILLRPIVVRNGQQVESFVPTDDEAFAAEFGKLVAVRKANNPEFKPAKVGKDGKSTAVMYFQMMEYVKPTPEEPKDAVVVAPAD